MWEAEVFGRVGTDGNASNIQIYNPYAFQTYPITTAAGINNYATLQMFDGDILLASAASKIYNSAGHLILSSSVGSRITVSGSLLVTDLSTVTTRGPIVNDTGHLILSSSVGSIVAVSGNLKVTGDVSSANLDSRYVLTSSYTAVQVTGSDNFFVNDVLTVSGSITNPVGNLILSSSVGSLVTVSGSLRALTNIIARGLIGNDSGHLILSSSASVIAFSASADFVNTDKNYHLTSRGSHLILSSSASTIAVSGNLKVIGGTVWNPVGQLILSSGLGSTVLVNGILNVLMSSTGLIAQTITAAGNVALGLDIITAGSAGQRIKSYRN